MDGDATGGVEAGESAGVLAAGLDERQPAREQRAAVERVDLEPPYPSAAQLAAERMQQLVDRNVDPPGADQPGEGGDQSERSLLEAALEPIQDVVERAAAGIASRRHRARGQAVPRGLSGSFAATPATRRERPGRAAAA